MPLAASLEHPEGRLSLLLVREEQAEVLQGRLQGQLQGLPAMTQQEES